MTSTSSSRVVVVGSINADLTVRVDRHPAPGETLLGSGGALTPGGKGANQAVAAARMGADTALLGAVGDDASADPATALLRASGVDLTGVSTVEGPTGLAVVTVSEAGENTIVVVPGANAAVSTAHVDEAAPLISTAALCVLQGELPADTTEHAIRLADSAGVRVMLNLAPVIPVGAELLALADPLVVNEHEARLALEMLGADVEDVASEDPVARALRLATALRKSGPRSVVVTVGAAGAVVAHEGAEPAHLPAPRVEARDTTGAGDAFVGALAAGLVDAEDLETAAARAVRVGAYSVLHHGAQPSFPTREDVLP